MADIKPTGHGDQQDQALSAFANRVGLAGNSTPTQQPVEPAQEAVTETAPQVSEQETVEQQVETQVSDSQVNSESNAEELSQGNPTQETPEQTDEEINTWSYTAPEETETTEQVSTSGHDDYQDIGKALETSSHSPEAILGAVTQLKSSLETLKQENETLKSQDPFADEKLKEANEFAKNGGNLYEYLGIASTNWDAYSDEQLLDMQVKQFLTDDEKRAEYIEGLDENTKAFEASKIRSHMKGEQQARLDKMQSEAQAQKQDFESGVRKELDSTESMFNRKLSKSDKDEIYSNLTEAGMNSLIYFDGNQRSYQRMKEAAFLLKRDKQGNLVNLQSIVANEVRKATNAGKKEVFEAASNKQVSRQGALAQTQEPAEQKSGVSSAIDFLKSKQQAWAQDGQRQ